MPKVLAEASDCVYYVKAADLNKVLPAHQSLTFSTDQTVTNLPVVTGFGIRTPEAAGEAATLSDGAVVGSAIVDIIANNLSMTATP